MTTIKVPFGEVARVVVHEMLDEPEWRQAFLELESRWLQQGMQFFSPGGSSMRRLASLVGELLNSRLDRGAESTMRGSKDPETNALIERFYEETKKRLRRDGILE